MMVGKCRIPDKSSSSLVITRLSMTIPLCGTMNMLSEIKCLKETVEASTIGIISVNMKVKVADH